MRISRLWGALRQVVYCELFNKQLWINESFIIARVFLQRDHHMVLGNVLIPLKYMCTVKNSNHVKTHIAFHGHTNFPFTHMWPAITLFWVIKFESVTFLVLAMCTLQLEHVPCIWVPSNLGRLFSSQRRVKWKLQSIERRHRFPSNHAPLGRAEVHWIWVYLPFIQHICPKIVWSLKFIIFSWHDTGINFKRPRICLVGVIRDGLATTYRESCCCMGRMLDGQGVRLYVINSHLHPLGHSTLIELFLKIIGVITSGVLIHFLQYQIGVWHKMF